MMCEGFLLTLFVAVDARPADMIALQSIEPFPTMEQCSEVADHLMVNHLDEGVRYFGSQYVLRCTPSELSPACRGE